MPSSNSFRPYVWDPFLLLCQIAAVQAAFYATLGVILSAVAHWASGTVSLALLFSFRALEMWQVIPAFVLNSLLMSIVLWLVVGRARQCWDFAVTAHLIHLVACCAYGGFPAYWTWWIMNVACGVIMTICAEFLCMRLDMQAIEMSHVRLNNASK